MGRRATVLKKVKNINSLGLKTYYHYLYNKVYNYNFGIMGAYVGDTGSGKSMAALHIAETLDPTFSIDDVIYGSVKEYLKKINSKDKKDTKTGKAIVFDEAGAGGEEGANSRRFWSDLNQALSTTAQTQRYMRKFVFFTLPQLDFLDKQTRVLMNLAVNTERLGSSNVVIYPRYLYYDRMSYKGGEYRRMPSVITESGIPLKFKSISRMPLPSKSLRDEFNVISESFKNKLIAREHQKILEREAADNPEAIDMLAKRAWDQANLYKLNNKFDRELLQYGLGISRDKANAIKKMLNIRNEQGVFPFDTREDTL